MADEIYYFQKRYFSKACFYRKFYRGRFFFEINLKKGMVTQLL